jgi:hypothetical protein
MPSKWPGRFRLRTRSAAVHMDGEHRVHSLNRPGRLIGVALKRMLYACTHQHLRLRAGRGITEKLRHRAGAAGPLHCAADI